MLKSKFESVLKTKKIATLGPFILLFQTENYIICKIKHKEKKEEEKVVEVISEDEHDTNGGNF